MVISGGLLRTVAEPDPGASTVLIDELDTSSLQSPTYRSIIWRVCFRRMEFALRARRLHGRRQRPIHEFARIVNIYTLRDFAGQRAPNPY
jgi:hypothetical protein